MGGEPAGEQLGLSDFEAAVDDGRVANAVILDGDQTVDGRADRRQRVPHHLSDRVRRRPDGAAEEVRRADRGRSAEAQRAAGHARHRDPARAADRRHPAVRDEPVAGWRRSGDAVRSQQAQDRQQGRAEDDVRRRRRCRRGDRGAAGGQGLSAAPGEVPGDGGEDPPRRAAVRPSRNRQDPARPRGRRRGGGAVLLDLGVGLRRDVRRGRCGPGARSVRASEGQRPGDRVHRRDRRRRSPAWRRVSAAVTTSASRR